MLRHYYIRSLLVLGMGIFLPWAAVAQPEEVFRANVRFFNPVSDTRDLYFMSNGEDREIRASFTGPSKQYRFESESPRMVLYRRSGSGDELKRTPVVDITLPESGKDYLVFMLPDRSGEGERYVSRIFDSTEGGLGKGKTRVYNLTDTPVAMKYGSLAFQLSAGTARTMPTQVTDAVRNRSSSRTMTVNANMPVQVAMKTDEGWKSVYRSIWYPMGDERIQVFIMPRAENSVRVFQIVD